MADENKTTENTEQATQDVDYIAAINELKNNTVPKEQFAKLKEENARLLSSLINGETIEGVATTEKADVQELRKELFSGEADLTNLQYVTKALELRDTLLESGHPDPFLPAGHQITPTNDDIEAANRVAKVLKECVEYADGDSAIFTNELQRVMIDTAPKIRK